MDHQASQVIAEMVGYLTDFVEVPHPVFGNLPVCPFARKARLDKTIMFQVYSFAQSDLGSDTGFMDIVTAFMQDDFCTILVVIHPDEQKLSVSDMDKFVESLNPKLAPLNLVVFGGHPQDQFNIQGIYTRRSPYPHLSIQSVPYLKQVTKSLQHTSYYDNWTPENLDSVDFHHRG